MIISQILKGYLDKLGDVGSLDLKEILGMCFNASWDYLHCEITNNIHIQQLDVDVIGSQCK